ncbi:stomatin-like protein 1 [Lytechinus variegatus]|uniref:stomatin-like protein 1 n=1 Tax=Lytechinus variegatus TaxID=7654 RepID=UPI001BB1D185|nr:stomatin-like protein 1 [Lytechinus variegatus]XP_041485624.1 stomatin-like protein 1 [Lytechinus variegatus]XP_041485625.1 stomatin-like protein 1 [Lytechinus variegatus]
MPRVQYSRLPMADSAESSPAKDSVALDFSSVHNFKSVFSYSKAVPPYLNEVKEYKPPILSSVCSTVVVLLSFILLLLTFPVSGWVAIKMVQQFERIVIFRLGRMKAPQGPGVVLVNPFIDKWQRVDMRTRAFNVPPQQLLTSNGAAISAGAIVYHRIMDVALSIASIQDMNHAMRNLGHTILLNLLSSRELSAIERDKALINAEMQDLMNTATLNWGVEISRAEISEITVIQDAMPASVDFQKVTGVLGQVAGQMAGQMAAGAKPQKGEPPSALASLLSMVTASPNQTPALTMASSPNTYHQPRLTVPHSVPVASNLVELGGNAPATPEQLIQLVQPVLDEQLVEEVGAVFKFNVTGASGGVYYLDLARGAGQVGVGLPPCTPDVTLTMSIEDMRAMFEGELRPAVAYMSGRLELEGDRNIAMTLEKVIGRIREGHR